MKRIVLDVFKIADPVFCRIGGADIAGETDGFLRHTFIGGAKTALFSPLCLALLVFFTFRTGAPAVMFGEFSGAAAALTEETHVPLPENKALGDDGKPKTLKRYDPVSGRLAVGSRMLRLKLKKNQKGEPLKDSFVGSIDKLGEIQNRCPEYLFVQYAFIPYFGVGWQRDRIGAKTLTTMPRELRTEDRKTDGDLLMRGRLLYLFLRWPNSTPLTPFAEFGKARFDNKFYPDPVWHARGRRQFVVEPVSRADYWGGGLEYKLARRFVVDFYFRAMDVDVPAVYVFRGDSRVPEPFVFTMKHIRYGMGARVAF